MAEMERFNQAQLISALARIETPSERRLNDADGQELALLLEQMADRYPSQDLKESMEGYLEDFEALALRYSLQSVKLALRELRITPGQRFFPRPDEVAEEIERMLEADREARNDQVQRDQETRKRKQEIDFFWNEFVPGRIDRCGETEAEILERWPSMRGTKPSTGGNR